MPPNPERRNQILGAAIDILCDDGVGGLTHRQVDSRAGVPAGTTSNYFRTRQALLSKRLPRAPWTCIGSAAAAVKSATLIFEAAGFAPAPERIDELSRLLNGFVFSNLTIAPESGVQDAAGLVDRLLSAFLD